MSDEIGRPSQKPPFEPYIAAGTVMPELTVRSLLMGTILGMLFGASSLFLTLKVGLTVSASIPVAVISVTLFKLFSRIFGTKDASILENNIAQTAGSAGESIAFGVGVTMPAILILGFDLEIARVLLVGVLGGLLGILMMIPLRRALIVQQHETLKYPEGTACAQVLKVGASEESKALSSTAAKAEAAAAAKAGLGGDASAKTIFWGFGIGFVYQFLIDVVKLWKYDPGYEINNKYYKSANVGGEFTPTLLGVGYIIGPRIAAVMTAGGVLAYLVLIPMIKFFGESIVGPLAPGTIAISEMSAGQVRGAYILYIGAGAVATGGIISLVRSLPTIWRGLKAGLNDLRADKGADTGPTLRTDNDISMRFVLFGILLLVAAILFSPSLKMNILGAIMIVLFGFLFVTVSSRLTGEIGSSSNPISGMTIATLLLTCLIFLLMGWTERNDYVTALSVGAIVCIAASNGGTTSQDLKTGYLVGATPRLQQIAILVGAGASALILGPLLLLLNDRSTVYLPAVTFNKIKGEITLPASELAQVKTFESKYKPPVEGEYQVFTQSPENAKKDGATLDAGDYLVSAQGAVQFKVSKNFPEGLATDPSKLEKRESLLAPQNTTDDKSYLVWHNIDQELGGKGKYLVDDQGKVVYFVDPGINGTAKERPDGSTVTKFDAPKATLVSYIIEGILSQQLPWGLVIFGMMLAFVFELAGVPSLAFAVGLYLPLAASTPILAGGIVRLLIDNSMKEKFKGKNLTEDQLSAEADKSPGVLMASGYIAGGSIAGVMLAALAGFFEDSVLKPLSKLAESNFLYTGHYADALSLFPFLAIAVVLFLVGKEKLLSSK
jgi:putative OPT family oligopeptide transporter